MKGKLAGAYGEDEAGKREISTRERDAYKHRQDERAEDALPAHRVRRHC